MEHRVSGHPLRGRRKRPAIHLDWNTRHRVPLVQVPAAAPNILSDIALACTDSTTTDAAASAAAANASAARVDGSAVHLKASASVVDAAPIAGRYDRGLFFATQPYGGRTTPVKRRTANTIKIPAKINNELTVPLA